MSVTIKDIARYANTSINTVSRALNNKPDVNAKTQERILRIAKKLNYTPNSLAKSLISRQSYTLGVIVTDNSNTFYAQVIKGIEDASRERGYNIILCNTDENSKRESDAMRLLEEKRVDGILITPVQRNKNNLLQMEHSDIPFVLLNRHPSDINADYVINDNAYGAKLATERLLDIGRTRILHLSGPASISSAQERLKGCRQVFKERKLPLQGLEVVSINLKLSDGYSAMKKALHNDPLPGGVFAYSDMIAIGAMKAIREKGLRIPEDIALIGYDDIEFAEYLEIPLTTIRQPRYLIGEKAAQILIDKISSKESLKPQRIVLRPELIIRKSA